jgi:Domain of unknown function (DUF4265)
MPSERTEQPGHVKILFRMERDARGWPPVDVEGIWATRASEGGFIVDNTPFYARGIALGDVVAAVEVDGELYFSKILAEGGHGTIRILLKNQAQLEEVSRRVEGFGCEIEYAPPRLIAVDVVPGAAVDELLGYLASEQEASRLGYEVGCRTW